MTDATGSKMTAAGDEAETKTTGAAAARGKRAAKGKTTKAAPKRKAAAKGKTAPAAKAKTGKTTPKRKPAAKTRASVKAAPKAAPQAGAEDAQAKRERYRVLDEVLGQVTRLMTASPRHRYLFLADLEWLVQPPLALGQARVLRDEHGNPLAFACWASVSHEVGQRLATGNPRLTPNEWASGDTLWLIDVIAPDAAIPGVLKTLQEQVFKGQKVRTMFKAPGGKGAAEPVASTEV